MTRTGKEDLRVVKTIEAVKGAFEALICEKPETCFNESAPIGTGV